MAGLSTNQEKKERQLANLRPRKKGDPPLPNAGRPKKLPITEALQKIFADPELAAAYAAAAVRHAKRGSSAHFKEINDRVDGAIPKREEHTGADGGPIAIEHTIKFGDGKPDER